MLGAFAAGVPVRLRYLQTPITAADPISLTGLPAALEATYTSRVGPDEAEALRALGLSTRFYALVIVGSEVALVAVCALVGFFIFLRRWDGWLALWVSLVLILLGTATTAPQIPSLAITWSGWWLIFVGAGALGMISNLHMLFISPDGRFVPRWTMLVAAGFTGSMLALALYSPQMILSMGGPIAPLLFILIATPPWLVLIGIGFFAQVYRYRRVSTATQRQQTKWVAIGFSGVTLGFVVHATLLGIGGLNTGQTRVLMNLVHAPVVSLCLMTLPICLGLSIVRYRLWDIDLLIRRTLIYSLLTAGLALVYFSSVVLLQSILGTMTGENQSEFVTVLSTLAIAALFVPLRRRVQDFIDRLFYRRKYDAAQTLAAFSASIRDETDLETVTQRLQQGVDQAMQPRHTSVWLRSAGTAPEP